MDTNSSGKAKAEREHLAQMAHVDRPRSMCRACCVCGATGKSRRLRFDSRIGRDLCDRHFIPSR